MSSRHCWFMDVENLDDPGFVGRGEVAPLEGLSEESPERVERDLKRLQEWLAASDGIQDEGLNSLCSSVRFGFEMAMAELGTRERGIFFECPLLQGVPVPINGLVWMSGAEAMQRQAMEKAMEGYQCIKFKVGGLAFEEELKLLQWVRNSDWGRSITLRLDANGAFAGHDVFEKLEQLSIFDIHSIEQPVKAGQYELMKSVCSRSPIPVALDEELIGIHGIARDELIAGLRPSYLVLKPTLHGGFSGAGDWIEIAGRHGAGWWITSSLESPLGLAALAQFTSAKGVTMPQGLGTGRIFEGVDGGETFARAGNLYFGHK